MKTVSRSLTSTLALAYRNGANYLLNGQTYANVPAGKGLLFRIDANGVLSSVSDEEWDELAKMSVPSIHNRPQGEREIPTE